MRKCTASACCVSQAPGVQPEHALGVADEESLRECIETLEAHERCSRVFAVCGDASTAHSLNLFAHGRAHCCTVSAARGSIVGHCSVVAVVGDAAQCRHHSCGCRGRPLMRGLQCLAGGETIKANTKDRELMRTLSEGVAVEARRSAPLAVVNSHRVRSSNLLYCK